MPRSKMPLPLALLASLALLGPLSPPLAAESSPEAQKWLDKLQTVFEKGSFTLEFSGSLAAASVGEGTLEGNITYGDPTHSKARIVLELAAPEGSGGDAAKMQLLSVQDGTSKWDEVEMLGAYQVTRAPLEAAGATAGLDPVSQLRQVSQSLDFEVHQVAEGRVELAAALDDTTRRSLGQLGSIPGVHGFVLALDEKTGHPLEFRAQGDPPAVRMVFEELTFVDRSSLDDKTFSYEPPAGAQVLDLGGS